MRTWFIGLLRACGYGVCMWAAAQAQSVTVRGKVVDAASNAPLIGASVALVGGATNVGAVTDADGEFSLKTPQRPSLSLRVSYIGYYDSTLTVASAAEVLRIQLRATPEGSATETVEIVANALLERQKQSPLSVESLTLNAIKQTSAANFYEGLGQLKGVDLTSASIGFRVINTRGFNSTSPVRSLQIIDGIDNQSPGLNFSLGNFLGASELDVEGVDLVVGASSAFYGPNAFNGVIALRTKSPFIHKGLSAMLKLGERNLVEAALRYAQAYKVGGQERLAFKLNAFYFRANDWEANSAEEVEQADSLRVSTANPGGYDAVNRYGDENITFYNNDFDTPIGNIQQPGLGKYYRTGYLERDVVDYNTQNVKLGAALHYKVHRQTEVIASSNFGTGTTVYQGDNRYSLKNILFFQHRIEVRNPDKFFVRAYATHEDAGDSYDAVQTAFRLQELTGTDKEWYDRYKQEWAKRYRKLVQGLPGFPTLSQNPNEPYDYAAYDSVLLANTDSLMRWHGLARAFADANYAAPGSARFDSLFRDITARSFEQGGTRFVDRSALFHLHGEYKHPFPWATLTVGGNGRLYRPNSEGTIFSDTLIINNRDTPQADTTGRVRLSNYEYGLYVGAEKKILENRLKFNAACRLDKNQNFDYLLSPAASAVWNVNEHHVMRATFSSAIRNPTLSDQFLYYNVGRAVLLGNTTGYQDLVTLDSYIRYSNSYNAAPSLLDSFDIAPVQPEKVRTFEVGYRGVFDKLYIDAGYYRSFYRDFIGYRLAVRLSPEAALGLYVPEAIYRVASNAATTVTTQGASIGLNYYFKNGLALNGNYSWNRLVLADTTDELIPAFNTPEHKFNVGLSGRDMKLGRVEGIGFNVNYKWVQGFLFEGSPQFTGFVPTYDMLDMQVNKRFDKLRSTLKVGCSNVLNNAAFQVYGGPRIGRLAYLSWTFDTSNL